MIASPKGGPRADRVGQSSVDAGHERRHSVPADDDTTSFVGSACRGAHQLFYAPTTEQEQRALVAKFCDHCPTATVAACRADALAHKDFDWVRGGLIPRELRKLTRKPRRSRAALSLDQQPAPANRPDPLTEGTPPTMDQMQATDKVRKLLNLAARAGTDEEANAAFALAFDLMEKYSIDDAALRDASTDGSSGLRDDPLVNVVTDLSSSTWRVDHTLASYVAQLTDCYIQVGSYQSGYPAKVFWYGRRSNVLRAVELFAALQLQASACVARHKKDFHGQTDPRKFAASVREGFVVALCKRLLARHTERQAPSTPGSGLVPVSLRDEAKAFAPTGSPSRAGSRSIDTKGWSLGLRDGQNAGLGDSALAGRRALNA